MITSTESCLHTGSCHCRDGQSGQQRIRDGPSQGLQPVLFEFGTVRFSFACFLFECEDVSPMHLETTSTFGDKAHGQQCAFQSSPAMVKPVT